MLLRILFIVVFDPLSVHLPPVKHWSEQRDKIIGEQIVFFSAVFSHTSGKEINATRQTKSLKVVYMDFLLAC